MNKRFVIIIVLGLLLSTIIVGLLIPKAKVYKYAYTINYSDVSIVLSLFENAEYVGNYTNYSSDVSSLIK